MAQYCVGFDLDGVMVNSMDAMAASVSKECGRPVNWQDWAHYDFYVSYGVSPERFLQGMITECVLENSVPMPGAKEAIDRLRARGVLVGAVTARHFHPNGEDVTRQWLERWGIKVDVLELVHHNESKFDKLQDLRRYGKLLCYVDDYLGHLHQLQKLGIDIPMFVMDQPWNRTDDTFPRVFTLNQYVDHALALHRHNDSLMMEIPA